MPWNFRILQIQSSRHKLGVLSVRLVGASEAWASAGGVVGGEGGVLGGEGGVLGGGGGDSAEHITW